MKDYMFVCAQDPNLFRYFKFGEKWSQCYVFEFRGESDTFENVYWGNHAYVEPDRKIISELLTISFLPDQSDKWKQIDYDFVHNDIHFKNILELAESKIKTIERK
jgi:thiamine kinase-like enzyme